MYLRGVVFVRTACAFSKTHHIRIILCTAACWSGMETQRGRDTNLETYSRAFMHVYTCAHSTAHTHTPPGARFIILYILFISKRFLRSGRIQPRIVRIHIIIYNVHAHTQYILASTRVRICCTDDSWSLTASLVRAHIYVLRLSWCVLLYSARYCYKIFSPFPYTPVSSRRSPISFSLARRGRVSVRLRIFLHSRVSTTIIVILAENNEDETDRGVKERAISQAMGEERNII